GSPRMTNSDAVPPVGGQSCRRFHLWDAMILVAAIAVGLALGKVTFSACYPRRQIPPAFRRFYAIEGGHAAAFPCVQSLVVAVLPLRLRRPRPPLSRLLRQPGVVACCTSVVVLVIGAIAVRSFGGTSPSSFVFIFSRFTGMNVAVAWVMLWFSGWW